MTDLSVLIETSALCWSWCLVMRASLSVQDRYNSADSQHTWTQTCDPVVTGHQAFPLCVRRNRPQAGQELGDCPASPVQPLSSLLEETGRSEHRSNVSSLCQDQAGMATVCLVVWMYLPVPLDSFPGCTSPPVAVPWPHWAAPWQTGHSVAGGGRSEHTAHEKTIRSCFALLEIV